MRSQGQVPPARSPPPISIGPDVKPATSDTTEFDGPSVEDILLEDMGARQKLLALISVVLGGIVTALFWPVVPTYLCIAWITALILVQVARLVGSKIVFKRSPKRQARGTFLTMASAATGVVWGALGAFFYVPSPAVYQIVLPFLLAGMVAGSALSLPSHLPSFFAFYIPALTPYAGHLLLQPDTIERILGLITLLFGLGIGVIGWQFHRTIQRSVGLGLRNGELVGALRRSQQELERRVTERTEQLHATNEALGREIEERRRSEEKVRHLVHHDALTGLPNRLLFRDRLVQGMARATREGQLLAVMMLDLDRFKQVNDRFGHPAGDELLAAVAGRLRSCVRDTDTLARFGGDEFTLVQTDLASPTAAMTLASKLVMALATAFPLAGEEVEATITIGIAIFPGHGDTPEQLVKCADIALYRGKAGGSAVCLYMPDDR